MKLERELYAARGVNVQIQALDLHLYDDFGHLDLWICGK